MQPFRADRAQLEDLFARATATAGDPTPVPVAMLVFAHPDDETVAMGARLARLSIAHLVHVTDGAPRNQRDSQSHGFQSLAAYQRARVGELQRALQAAGVDRFTRECLGVPDQEASLCLAGLTRRILHLFETHRPEVVFTHPYEGGHPDHDACAFAMHHAASLYSQGKQTAPLLIEAAFYHAGPRGIATGAFLPSPLDLSETPFPLSPEERHRKQTMFACFTTQQETLRYFPLDAERFRLAPRYDFLKPPHDPPLFYDRYPWGMTSSRFCELALEAEHELAQQAVPSCP